MSLVGTLFSCTYLFVFLLLWSSCWFPSLFSSLQSIVWEPPLMLWWSLSHYQKSCAMSHRTAKIKCLSCTVYYINLKLTVRSKGKAMELIDILRIDRKWRRVKSMPQLDPGIHNTHIPVSFFAAQLSLLIM